MTRPTPDATTAADAEAHAALDRRDQEEAARLFPGARYRDVLGWLHEAVQPSWYLEIGVGGGHSLARTLPQTSCIAVDPAARLEAEPPSKVFLAETTSDAFFASGVAERILSGARIDLCFLDGMHTYDQTLRDLINAAPLLSPEAPVILHDVLPLNDRVGNRERLSRFWTGDVWKIVPILQRYQPDLEMVFVPAAPSGLIVLRRVGAATMTVADRFEEAVAWADDLRFGAAFSDAIWRLPRCANTRDAVMAAFSGSVDPSQ